MRLRRQGLDQLPRPHQRPQAPAQPRHVHEDRALLARPGQGALRRQQEEAGGEAEDLRLPAEGRRLAGRRGKYMYKLESLSDFICI